THLSQYTIFCRVRLLHTKFVLPCACNIFPPTIKNSPYVTRPSRFRPQKSEPNRSHEMHALFTAILVAMLSVSTAFAAKTGKNGRPDVKIGFEDIKLDGDCSIEAK